MAKAKGILLGEQRTWACLTSWWDLESTHTSGQVSGVIKEGLTEEENSLFQSGQNLQEATRYRDLRGKQCLMFFLSLFLTPKISQTNEQNVKTNKQTNIEEKQNKTESPQKVPIVSCWPTTLMWALPWEHLLLNGCLHETLPLKAQKSMWKKRWKDCNWQGCWMTSRTSIFQTQEDWYIYELTEN